VSALVNDGVFYENALMMGDKVERALPIEPAQWGCFLLLHLAVCFFAGLFGSPKALTAVIVVSILATLRYAAMVTTAMDLGRRGKRMVIAASLWLSALIALAVALFLVGRYSKASLPWAAAAALAGPATVMLSALWKGIAALVSSRTKEAAA
jgi:hypothetical protein